MNWSAVLTAMLPENILLVGIVLVAILEVVSRRPGGAHPLSVLVVALASASAFILAGAGYTAAPFAGHFSVAPATLAAKGVLIALLLPVLLLAREDFAEDSQFDLLILSSLYGACLMVTSDSFLTLFLGLEVMSLPVYALVLLAYARGESAEASLKYLVLGGAASAAFLMGASLLYGSTGSLAISAFSKALSSGDALAQGAVTLIVVSFFLKGAIVPFHAWAPDAYEAASIPVTAYMATVIKAGVLLAAVRLFGDAPISPAIAGLLVLLPLVSMVWGNLAAMKQNSFRRMIAYSSIAHAGYLFFAFLGAPGTRFTAVMFYILAYGVMSLLAFASLPRSSDDRAADSLENMKGLFSRDPFAALMIGLAMLSLAGIPPLPGFIGKFLIFKNVIASGFTLWAVLGLIGSYLGIYFYLRVIQYMFMNAQDRVPEAVIVRRSAIGASIVCLIPATLVAVLPAWFIRLF